MNSEIEKLKRKIRFIGHISVIALGLSFISIGAYFNGFNSFLFISGGLGYFCGLIFAYIKNKIKKK